MKIRPSYSLARMVSRICPRDSFFLFLGIRITSSKNLSFQVFATRKAKRMKSDNISMISVILGDLLIFRWLVNSSTILVADTRL